MVRERVPEGSYAGLREQICRAGECLDPMALATALHRTIERFCEGLIDETELQWLSDVSEDVLCRLMRERILDDEE